MIDINEFLEAYQETSTYFEGFVGISINRKLRLLYVLGKEILEGDISKKEDFNKLHEEVEDVINYVLNLLLVNPN